MNTLKQNIQDPSFIGTQGLKGLQGIDSTEDTSNYSYGIYTPSMSVRNASFSAPSAVATAQAASSALIL